MDTLPTEVIINILLNLSYKDIVNFCSTNKSYLDIFNDDRFWKSKCYYDKSIDTWKQQYESYVKCSCIYMAKKDANIIGKIYYNKNEAIDDIIKNIEDDKVYIEPLNIDEYSYEFRKDPCWMLKFRSNSQDCLKYNNEITNQIKSRLIRYPVLFGDDKSIIYSINKILLP